MFFYNAGHNYHTCIPFVVLLEALVLYDLQCFNDFLRAVASSLEAVLEKELVALTSESRDDFAGTHLLKPSIEHLESEVIAIRNVEQLEVFSCKSHRL